MLVIYNSRTIILHLVHLPISSNMYQRPKCMALEGYIVEAVTIILCVSLIEILSSYRSMQTHNAVDDELYLPFS